MQRRTFVAAGGALTLSPALVRAQAWPAKSIRFIVPYIPGSAPDVLARTMSERLGSALGQSLVIENRPGAGSTSVTRSLPRHRLMAMPSAWVLRR